MNYYLLIHTTTQMHLKGFTLRKRNQCLHFMISFIGNSERA